MTITQLIALDTETTGLDPARHEMWEFAALLADHDTDAHTLTITDRIHYDLLVTLEGADGTALRIGGYYERRDHNGRLPWATTPTDEAGAERIAYALAGRHIIGANPAFDVAFIDRYLRARGHAPAHLHHLIDVSPLVAGYLQGVGQAQHDAGKTACRHDDLIDIGVPPYRSGDLADAIGVTVDAEDRHTAPGDAFWALDQYAAVYGLEVIDGE